MVSFSACTNLCFCFNLQHTVTTITCLGNVKFVLPHGSFVSFSAMVSYQVLENKKNNLLHFSMLLYHQMAKIVTIYNINWLTFEESLSDI